MLKKVFMQHIFVNACGFLIKISLKKNVQGKYFMQVRARSEVR